MANWKDQSNNMGTRYKLLVYFYPTENKINQTYWAFAVDEKKGLAIKKLTDRILLKSVLGKYKTAIFYDNGVEIERWEDGIKK